MTGTWPARCAGKGRVKGHEPVIPPEELYHICRAARSLLVGKHGVARVIARPFAGLPGSFYRTKRRRDFSLPPPRKTLLDLLGEANLAVVGIGKESDILVVAADHECDPTTPSTDHSRGYVPLLISGKKIRSGVDLGARGTFADLGQTIAEAFQIGPLEAGRSFWERIAEGT